MLIEDLVDPTAKVVALASSFEFVEGPVWHPGDHFLRFSDIKGNTRYRWNGATAQEDVRPSNKGNGMTYDSSLGLLVCEHATSCLVRYADGGRSVVASHFGGKQLNSPNDVIVGSDGAIYFTDPTYGRMPGYGVEREVELGFQGVYRIAPGASEPELIVEEGLFGQPNGLCLSPDESRLYVNDTRQTNIRVFDIANGRLSNMRLLAEGIASADVRGAPDGMKCDAAGNVWVTGPGGIWVFDPAGALLGKIGVPEQTANFHWGGADWRTLFITATTTLYALPVKIGPRVEPFMRAA